MENEKREPVYGAHAYKTETLQEVEARVRKELAQVLTTSEETTRMWRERAEAHLEEINRLKKAYAPPKAAELPNEDAVRELIAKSLFRHNPTIALIVEKSAETYCGQIVGAIARADAAFDRAWELGRKQRPGDTGPTAATKWLHVTHAEQGARETAEAKAVLLLADARAAGFDLILVPRPVPAQR